MLEPKPYILDYEKMALGLFVHFGAYSQYRQGEWTLNARQMDPVAYEKQALATDFSSFDPENLIRAAKLAGCRYITLTTRHHDGFSLYDTRGLSGYDIMHTPNGRDLIQEFVTACREADIVPFFYHTTLDWHHPDFEGDFDRYLDYLYRSVEILCTSYGKIGGFWFDGNWSKPDADWKLDRLYGMIRRLQPEAIINNNTGLHEPGDISHPEVDAVTFEQDRPSGIFRQAGGKYISGEMCFTLNEHWGAARDCNYKSMRWVIESVAQCRALGCNALVNVGPEADSSVALIQQGMLQELGNWVNMCREVFYTGRPGPIQSDFRDFSLRTPDGTDYVFILDSCVEGEENVMRSTLPVHRPTFRRIPGPVREICWLDDGSTAAFSQDPETGTLVLEPVRFPYGSNWVVRVAKLVYA